MFAVITGGSGSGKSEYAENLAVELGRRDCWYIATMIPWDGECEARIRRHRLARAGKGFETVERPRDLKGLFLPPGEHTILLECMSNLVSNEMFSEPAENLEETGKKVTDKVIRGVIHLKKQAENLIIVTNEVFSEGEEYGRETEEYRRVLGAVNVRMAAMADRVTEVVAGIPLRIK